MWPTGFYENKCHSIATEGVMSNRKHIPEPQARAIGHRDPCGQQDTPPAVAGTSAKTRRDRHQVTNLNVAPRPRKRKGALDATDSLCTIVHYQPLSEGCMPQGDQHPAMVLDRGRGEDMQSLSQIAVDAADGQVSGSPGESPGQDLELLNVAGTGPNFHGVGKGEFGELHSSAFSGGDLSPDKRVLETPPGNRYNPQMLTSTPSSIGYGTALSALAWVAGEHRILRLAFLAALTAALWLNRLGVVCTLLVLGHVGESIKDEFRGRTP